jgi:hypothetical protein
LGFALLTFKSLDCDFFGSFGLSSTVAVVGKAATLPRRVRAHGVLDLLALTDLPPAMKPNCGSGIVAFRLIESPLPPQPAAGPPSGGLNILFSVLSISWFAFVRILFLFPPTLTAELHRS